MNSKEIAQILREALHQVKLNQAQCELNGLQINKLTYVIDHLDSAIDLLEPQEPWV